MFDKYLKAAHAVRDKEQPAASAYFIGVLDGAINTVVVLLVLIALGVINA